MGIDIRDHGGNFGGGGAKSLHISKTPFAPKGFVKVAAGSSPVLYGNRYLGDGILLTISSYSGSMYRFQFFNEAGDNIVTNLFDFGFTIAFSNNQLSNFVKLPDGRYVFSVAGDVFTISSDFNTMTKVKTWSSYGSGYAIVVLFMSTQGKLILVDMQSKVFIMNPSTFASETGPPHTVSNLTVDAVGQILETDSVVIIKSGNASGNFVKINKSVTSSVTPILFSGNTSNAYGLVGDDTYYYSVISGTLYKHLISTMALVASYTIAAGTVTLFWDHLKKNPFILNTTLGTIQEFSTTTSTLETALSIGLSGSMVSNAAEDPINYRILIYGNMYNYGIRKV